MATELDQNDAFENVATQLFDVTINPLAGMICTFLQMQVSKGYLSKDEAKYVVASTVDLINQSGHREDILATGHNMLFRMMKAIDQIPNAAKKDP